MQDYMTIPLDLYTRYFLAGLLVGTGKRDSFAASVTLSRFPVLTNELALHRLDTFEKSVTLFRIHTCTQQHCT